MQVVSAGGCDVVPTIYDMSGGSFHYNSGPSIAVVAVDPGAGGSDGGNDATAGNDNDSDPGAGNGNTDNAGGDNGNVDNAGAGAGAGAGDVDNSGSENGNGNGDVDNGTGSEDGGVTPAPVDLPGPGDGGGPVDQPGAGADGGSGGGSAESGSAGDPGAVSRPVDEALRPVNTGPRHVAPWEGDVLGERGDRVLPGNGGQQNEPTALPFTGASVGLLALAGLLVVAVGCAVIRIGRASTHTA